MKRAPRGWRAATGSQSHIPTAKGDLAGEFRVQVWGEGFLHSEATWCGVRVKQCEEGIYTREGMAMGDQLHTGGSIKQIYILKIVEGRFLIIREGNYEHGKKKNLE